MTAGDVLLYSADDLVGAIIAAKGLTRYAHVEVYAGQRYTFAARRSRGVNIYPLRKPAAVYRAVEPLRWMACQDWFFHEAFGQPYDTVGVLLNPIAMFHGRENRKQFCSELAARMLRKGLRVDPFPGRDADGLHPGDFARSDAFRRVA